MSLVMLIEDEPVLRSSMARGLARLPNVEVIDASLFRDAVRLLDAERPDLIVSDLDLPDGSGVEILNVLDAIGLRVPVIFVTAYLGSFRGQLPNRSDVEVYEKPLPLVRLREVVMRHLDVEQGALGHDSPFSLADYLQLACMGRHSVVLDVAQRGDPVGRIVVVRGQVWSASAGRESGEEAVATLAFGTSGASTQVRRLVGEPGARDVQRPWQHILLNAARVHDEAVREQERDGARARPNPPLPRLSPSRSPLSGVEGGRRSSRRASSGGRPSASGRSSSSARPSGLPSAAGRAVSGSRGDPAPSTIPPAPGSSGRPSSPGQIGARGRYSSGPLPESTPPPPRSEPLTDRPGRRPSGSVDESPAELLRPDLPRSGSGDPSNPPPPPPPPGPADSRGDPKRPPTEKLASTPPPLQPSEAPQPMPPIAEAPVEADFATLMDRGLDAMLGRDYATAWRALQQADRLQPGVPSILANLARLRQLGFGDDS